MPVFDFSIIISAFIAGVLTFFAPCTLPLVPAFLGIISGVKGSGPLSEGDPTLYRWRIFKNAVFYVLGFSLVFISFGVAFSYLGTLFIVRELLEKVGGLFIIAFGLVLLGWLKIPWLDSGKQIAVPRLFRPVRSKSRLGGTADMPLASRTSNGISLANSFLLGAVFALGWSPCVGPLLGFILLLASTSGTVFEGTFLLVIFSIGLGLPFLVTALLIGKAFTAFGSVSSSARWGSAISVINKVAGIFLITIGFLLILGKFSLVHSQFKNYFYNFQYFEVFINKFL